MSDLESSSSGSSDSLFEERLLFNNQNSRPKPKNKDFFESVVPEFDEDQFFEHFRVSIGVYDRLAEEFEQSPYYNYQSNSSGKVTAKKQICIFLWFAGHQTASFRDVADRFGISISILHKIVKRVAHLLSDMSPQIIKWPTDEEKAEIEEYFRQKHFPGVIGAIDGSHIRIDKPAVDPDSYLNRKHFYSIQIQAVCDHERRIRDIFIGYPGSVHDSRVFRTSSLYQTLRQNCGRHYLLGDSAYPCLPNLLTPFRDNGRLTRRQVNFNLKLSQNRYVIEHCFGILKQKFRQLYHLKLRNIREICHFIKACCVLHNIALSDEVPIEDLEVAEDIQDVAAGDANNERADQNGVEVRNQVADILEL